MLQGTMLTAGTKTYLHCGLSVCEGAGLQQLRATDRGYSEM